MAQSSNCCFWLLPSALRSVPQTYPVSGLQTYPNLHPPLRVGPLVGCLPRRGANLCRFVPARSSQMRARGANLCMFVLVFWGVSCRWVRIWKGLELSDGVNISQPTHSCNRTWKETRINISLTENTDTNLFCWELSNSTLLLHVHDDSRPHGSCREGTRVREIQMSKALCVRDLLATNYVATNKWPLGTDKHKTRSFSQLFPFFRPYNPWPAEIITKKNPWNIIFVTTFVIMIQKFYQMIFFAMLLLLVCPCLQENVQRILLGKVIVVILRNQLCQNISFA